MGATENRIMPWGPSERPCSRYERSGVKCDNFTPQLDGWCRTCDGFAQAVPGPQETTISSGRSRWAPVPMPTAVRSRVRVTRTASDMFGSIHSGTAEHERAPQIQSLFRDAVRDGQAYARRSGKSYVRLGMPDGSPLSGYWLYLLGDLTAVTNYKANHWDLTYEQAKAGVEPRVGVRTFGQRMRAAGVPVSVHPGVVNVYGRKVLGMSWARTRSDAAMAVLQVHLTNRVVPLWKATTGKQALIHDGDGWVWETRGRPENGIVVALYRDQV